MVRITHTGLSPTMAELSNSFCLSHHCHWPGPRSLAATDGVSVDVLSYGYLDVSVPRVRFLHLYIQRKIPFNDIWKPFLSSRLSVHASILRIQAGLTSGPGGPKGPTRSRACGASRRNLFPRKTSKEKEFEARRASQGRPAVAAHAARPRSAARRANAREREQK